MIVYNSVIVPKLRTTAQTSPKLNTHETNELVTADLDLLLATVRHDIYIINEKKTKVQLLSGSDIGIEKPPKDRKQLPQYC